MSDPVVLITFHCSSGETEKVALAAAVGAVQARALIRLRRLPDLGMTHETEPLLRMRKEYVPPAEKDILGADALIVVAPPDYSETSLQWKPYLEIMRRLADAGLLKNKVGACIGTGASLFEGLGMATVPALSGDALEIGRAVANAARSLNATAER